MTSIRQAIMATCFAFALVALPNIGNADEYPVISAGKTHIFLSTSDNPIHIGDGLGKFADIPYKHQKTNPSTNQSWTFKLTSKVNSATIRILMYSLSSGCPSILSVNEQGVYNLATSGGVGSGKDTKIEVIISDDVFRPGLNTISITEKECRGGGINDSLIKEADLEVR